MKIPSQYFLVGLLLLSLILVSAGIGALAAKETRFGAAFLVSGGVLLAIDIVLVTLRHRQQPSRQAADHRDDVTFLVSQYAEICCLWDRLASPVAESMADPGKHGRPTKSTRVISPGLQVERISL
jgi:hypothetical protein